jgi:hypothetical protein
MVKRDNEELWNAIKDKILKEDIAGTKADQWSARKAQLCVKLYKYYGGGYIGKKDVNNSLDIWSKQSWRTKSGLPSSITNERYLPSKVINKLSDKDYNETSKQKYEDTKKNIQYSMQPKKIVKMIKNIDY